MAATIRSDARPAQLYLILLAGAVVLLAAGIAFVASHQSEEVYARNSPEGTVQRYLAALQNGHVDSAYSMTAMSLDRQRFHDMYDNWNQRSHQVVLVHADRQSDEASVTLDITTFSGGVFAASTDTRRSTITLERQGRGWRVTGPDLLPY